MENKKAVTTIVTAFYGLLFVAGVGHDPTTSGL